MSMFQFYARGWNTSLLTSVYSQFMFMFQFYGRGGNTSLLTSLYSQFMFMFQFYGRGGNTSLLTSLYWLFISMFQFYARGGNTSSTDLHCPHHQTPGGYVLVKDHGSRVRDCQLLAHGDTLTTQWQTSAYCFPQIISRDFDFLAWSWLTSELARYWVQN